MTWFTSSTNEAQSQLEHAQMFVAVDLNFSSGHARAWSGYGDITISGNTFTGTGTLGKITFPPDRVGLDASRKTFELSGVDPSLVSEADIEASFGRSVIEYIGFINQSTGALVDTPEVSWEGLIDSIRRVDGETPSIQVNAEHLLVLLEQPDGWRYTHEHQQQFYASDLGFDQVRAIQQKVVLWGGQRTVIGREPTNGGHLPYRPVYG